MATPRPLKTNSSTGDLADFASTDQVSTQNGGLGADASGASQGAIPIATGSGGFDFNILTPGTNITIDDSVVGQITINSSGGSGGFTVAGGNPQTANFNAAFQELYLVDASAGNVVCTLPDATTGGGQEIIVVCVANNLNIPNNLSFATMSSQMINGNAPNSYTPALTYTYYRFISDGSNYELIQANDQIDLALIDAVVEQQNGYFYNQSGAGIQVNVTPASLMYNDSSGSATQVSNLGLGSFVIGGSTDITSGSLFSVTSAQTSSFTAAVQSFNTVDTSGGAIVCTLPDGTMPLGQQVIVTLSVTGNNLTFATTSGQLINATTASSLAPLVNSGDQYTFTSDQNGNWWTELLSTVPSGNQNALTLFGGPNTPGASSATATFKTYDATVLFGGASNARPAPTTGTLTGDYYTSGSWTQTGTLTLNRCHLYFGADATFNGAVNAGNSMFAGPTTVEAFSPGTGLAPGGAARNGVGGAGNGGGHAGTGGSGGTGLAAGEGGGGGTYPFEATLFGSSGSAGSGDTTSAVGGAGGAGSDGIYIEAVGALSFSATAALSATGAVGANGPAASTGAGGAGSGGTIDIRTLGTCTVTSGAVFNVSGGNGGATGSGANPGGGGGGGYISILCAGTLTDSGTYTVSGGAAGTGANTGTAASAGSAGSSVRTGSTNVVPRRQF